MQNALHNEKRSSIPALNKHPLNSLILKLEIIQRLVVDSDSVGQLLGQDCFVSSPTIINAEYPLLLDTLVLRPTVEVPFALLFPE